MMRLSQVSRSVQAFFRELTAPTNSTNIPHDPRQRTLGVALGGGFARGMVHIGVLKVLEEAGIPIAAVAGTSSGSLVGAGFCSGRTAAEMAEIGSRMRFWDLARWTLERGGLCSNERLSAFLSRLCPCKDFSELRIPLAVVATELASGRPAVFRSGSLCDAIRASCAYPGIFTPVSIHGVLHVDGMLSYEVPTTPLKQMGIDCVLGVHLRTQWHTPETPRHFFDVIGQCFAIAQTRMSLQWARDADILLEPDVGNFAFDDFERTPELIAIGEQAMRAALPALKAKLGIEDKKAPSAERAVAPSAMQTPAWGAGMAHGSGTLDKL
jgi:NTE family protein